MLPQCECIKLCRKFRQRVVDILFSKILVPQTHKSHSPACLTTHVLRFTRLYCSAKTPEFLWAQRKDEIYLTINVPNVKKNDVKIQLTDEGHVYFKGMGGNVGSEQEYTLDINLFKNIKAKESKSKVTARTVSFKIIKEEAGPYWDRLLKEAGRNIHCKIDWDNWKDEDEDEDQHSFGSQFADNKDLQDMDFGSGASTSDEEDEVEGVIDAADSSNSAM